MQKFKRYIPYALAIAVTIVLILSNRFMKHKHPMDANYSDEFYSLVDHSDQKSLDLSQFSPFQWDEVTLWAPYADICDLGINDFEKEGPNCESTADDADAYLLFLNQNHLIQKIKLDRKKIDLVSSKISWRVKKESAKFDYLTQGDWPKVQVQGQGGTVKPAASPEDPVVFEDEE